VEVNVISDLSVEMPQSKDVSSRISNMTASPGGKRVVFEARGELFNVPVKEGFTLNMTQSSGAFDQNPAWSPDGKTIAYWSDKSGEYEIYLQDSEGKEPAKQLTKRGKGFGYRLFWSPNSKMIAFIDETNTIQVINIESGNITEAGNYRWNIGHGSRYGFPLSWSPDSKWLAFTQGLDNSNSAVFIFNTENKQLQRVTSGFYDDNFPTFSTDGKYLFYLTNRNLDASYSSLGDGTWIYPNSTQIASIALKSDTPSLLEPKNDEVEIEKEKEEETKEKAEEKEDEEKKGKDEDKDDEKDDGVKVEIDFENLEARLTILPPKAGNISALIPFEGKLVYLRRPNTGSGERSSSLNFFDLKEREEKEIMDNVSRVAATADGKSLIVSSQNKYGIIQPAAGQKIEKPIPTDGLVMDLIPKEEWKQIFADTWRRHRDFFYDPNMHGLDWEEIRDRYGKLLDDVRTRWDVTNLQLNLVAELSAGHTYAGGGDTESTPSRSNGFLGLDWEKDGNQYRIKRIVKPAEWDTEVRSPFDIPGVDVKEGDHLLSVNGISIDPAKDPYAAFEGLSGKTVKLEISRTGKKEDAKNIVVECLSPGQERNLRYLEWIENNRKMVDELSDGQLGYFICRTLQHEGNWNLCACFTASLTKKDLFWMNVLTAVVNLPTGSWNYCNARLLTTCTGATGKTIPTP
jgi:tricorn protease